MSKKLFYSCLHRMFWHLTDNSQRQDFHISFFWGGFCITLNHSKEKNNCLSVIINPLVICQTQADLAILLQEEDREILYSVHTELSLIINTWGMFSLLSNKHSVSTSLGIHWFTGKWSKRTEKEGRGGGGVRLTFLCPNNIEYPFCFICIHLINAITHITAQCKAGYNC